jgi:hypothetical protein
VCAALAVLTVRQLASTNIWTALGPEDRMAFGKLNAATGKRPRRVGVDVAGVYKCGLGPDVSCIVRDLSETGALVITDAIAPSVGQDVALYVKRLGQLHGRVARVVDGGFGIRFNKSITLPRDEI